MTAPFLPRLSSIEFASPYSVGLVCETLARERISCVAYGIAAIQCYGVELCLMDIEIVVRDAEVDLACTRLVESGLLEVTGSPARDDYGRKDDLRYLEPPSSAAAAWNDFSQKMYIVIYRESSVRLDVVADVDKEPQIADNDNEHLKYWIPYMKALHQSFLHVFLTSTFVEQEARMEMLLAYLHRELKVVDVPAAMKPGLALILSGGGGYSARREVKKEYSRTLW